MIKKGNYIKFYEIGQKPYLTFVSKSNKDIRFKVNQILKRKNNKICSSQNCEENEEKEKFEKILYIFYNIWGQPVKEIYLYFDFNKDIVLTESGRKYKVLDNYEYTYKIQKTQIKAINGISGFYKHIVESMHIDSPFNASTYEVIEQL